MSNSTVYGNYSNYKDEIIIIIILICTVQKNVLKIILFYKASLYGRQKTMVIQVLLAGT